MIFHTKCEHQVGKIPVELNTQNGTECDEMMNTVHFHICMGQTMRIESDHRLSVQSGKMKQKKNFLTNYYLNSLIHFHFNTISNVISHCDGNIFSSIFFLALTTSIQVEFYSNATATL